MGDAYISQAIQSTGFSQPMGIISGKVSYEGDVAVPGVSVIVEGSGEMNNKSLYFNKTAGTYVQIPFKKWGFSAEDFSFQGYILNNGINDGTTLESWVEGPYTIMGSSSPSYTDNQQQGVPGSVKVLVLDPNGGKLLFI